MNSQKLLACIILFSIFGAVALYPLDLEKYSTDELLLRLALILFYLGIAALFAAISPVIRRLQKIREDLFLLREEIRAQAAQKPNLQEPTRRSRIRVLS